MFEENADAKAIQASGYLEDLRNSARSEFAGGGGKAGRKKAGTPNNPKSASAHYSTPATFAVIICIFSSTREMTKEFMQAVAQSGLKTHEFVYILPWLQAEARDASPWIGTDGQMVQNVREYFTGSVIVSEKFAHSIHHRSFSDRRCQRFRQQRFDTVQRAR